MPKIMAEYLCTGSPCSVKQATGTWRPLCAQNEAWIKTPQNSNVVSLFRKNNCIPNHFLFLSNKFNKVSRTFRNKNDLLLA